ncbi:MAG: VWA domain-containing protein [Acidobacteriaceae bacterium]|nr:VWA domain-containing protein [Acidobacteriaceae bacterium]
MKPLALICTILLAIEPLLAQQRATFSTTTNVVIVNVTVLDRNGKPIENLTKDDFELYEDGKLQKLQAVDLQRLNTKVLPPVDSAAAQPPAEPKGYDPDAEKATLNSRMLSKYQDRRLIILLFDFSSMQPAEQIRAKQAAIKFLSGQMTASDTVSIMAFGSELQTLLDFTSDRDLLINTINKFRIGESSENATFADEGADAQDQSGQFVADETEFNIFNADLKLAALEDAARKLAQYPEKKALIYISSGIQKNGVDNQSQLRATVNTAVRANVAFYPIDARGLSALVPGGDATQAGAVGNNLYSGAGQRSLKENFNNQQETLATLALDTGGKALLDSNDLTEGMRQVQTDFTSYYVLSYVSSNTAQDGRYRRIQVKLSQKDGPLRAKLDYRQGYYGPTTFARMHDVDKEAQLSQAMLSDNPVTDLALAVEVDYFRLEKDKYFAPISVKIPGSALAFHSKGAKQATELDFIAEVFDTRNRAAAAVRDTIPLKVDLTTAGQVVRKSIQYDTGVTLTPGSYRLRFVARENGEGKIGTFETPFTIPDLAAGKALRISSVILSNQREPVSQQVAGVKNDKKLVANNPLIDKGQKLVPNVTKVFRSGQNMLVYVEVYDPTIPDSLPENFRRADVEATLALYRGDKKVYETPPVRANRLLDNRSATLPVWLQVPTSGIQPGKYDCQINLIDEFGRKFAFPRTGLAILATQPSNSEKTSPSTSGS